MMNGQLVHKHLKQVLFYLPDETYDLGSSSKWRDLFLSGSTIKLGGASISALVLTQVLVVLVN